MQTFGIVANGQVRDMTQEEVSRLSEKDDHQDERASICVSIHEPITMRGNDMFQNLFKIGAGGGEQRPPKPAKAEEPDEVVDAPVEPEAPAA